MNDFDATVVDTDDTVESTDSTPVKSTRAPKTSKAAKAPKTTRTARKAEEPTATDTVESVKPARAARASKAAGSEETPKAAKAPRKARAASDPVPPVSAAIAELIESDDPKMQRLLLWLEERGANLPSLKIGAAANGVRGVYANETIVDGELVMHIPKSAMITLQVAKESATGKLIATHGANVSDYGYMAAFLLEIRREGGFWQPYADVMPESFPEHPLFFSPTELEYLKGSYTLPMIQEQQNWLAYEYKQVLTCLAKGHAFTAQEFAWARCIVMTRTYTVTIYEEKSLAMVPLADMLNHSNEADVIWTGESTYGFSLYASKSVARGTHVYESYGRRCNGRLFVHHGFCLDANDANEAEIELPALLPAHPFCTYTKDLGTVVDDIRVFKVPLTYDESGTKALFSMLRLGCLEDMPGVFRTMVNGAKVDNVPPISRKNEVAALTALSAACQRRMGKFPTSIEEDEALLAGDTLSRKLRFAVMVRLGEKRILKHYQELAQTAISVLQNPFCDLRDYAKQGDRFGEYFEALHTHLAKSMD